MYRVLTKEDVQVPPPNPLPERFTAAFRGTIWETIRTAVFFMLDCTPFKCLYSEHMGRGCIPVNVMLLLAAIAKMERMSLREFCARLPGNLYIQYAVYADYLKALPSESSAKRFARAVSRYNQEHHIDLIESVVEDLSSRFAVIMGINLQMVRIDTVMVEVYATKLNRYQLIYVCTARLVRRLVRDRKITLPERLQHFTDAGDYNFVTYHNTTDSKETKMDLLLGDVAAVRDLCGDSMRETPEYQILERCMSNQTFTGDDGSQQLRKKGDKALNSGILQTPTDPDATFRCKRGEEHKGYSLCAADASNGKRHLVTAYRVVQNNVADGKVASDLLKALPDQNGEVTLVGDGGFTGDLLAEVAREKGWTVINTDFPGRRTADCFADTQFNEDGTELVHCPAGKAPDHFAYSEKTGSVTGWFPKDACEGCPLREQCHPTEQKAFNVRRFSVKQKNRALSQRIRSTEEFKKLAHFRNGVESDFSVLRRYYRIDEICSHGLYRVTYQIGLMILAMNIRAFHAALMDMRKEAAKSA